MTPASPARRVVESVRDAGPLWTASLILDRLVPWGVLGLWRDWRVTPDVLAAQITAILQAWGMSPEHTAITVEHVLYADLRGIDSHGSSMLRHYHEGVSNGSLTMTPLIEVVRDAETTALVDGGGGLGHVPADTAMKLAIAKCRAAGVGAIAVRNSGHFGAAGAYVSMATAAGFIGFVTTSTKEPAVVPTYGRDAQLGTNALAFAAPAARNAPFLLDMATSTASLGRITTAWRRGRSIPSGWAVDARGRPVTSGRAAAAGRRLTPLGSSRAMGSHKGYGLSVLVEILSSVLAGVRPRHRHEVPNGAVGHFCLAIDPQRFRAVGEFQSDLDTLLDALHATAPVAADQPVLVAGDPELAAEAERRRSGIPVSRSVVEDIRMVTRASGAPFLLTPDRR